MKNQGLLNVILRELVSSCGWLGKHKLQLETQSELETRFLGNYSHACASTKIWNKKIQMWKMADKRPLSGLNQFRLWWNKSREALGEMLTETKNGSALYTYSVHTSCYFFFNSIVFKTPVSIKMTRHCLQRPGQVLLLWRCQNGTFKRRGPTGRKS